MSAVTREHFARAAAEIGANGDNDTLPFDVDNRFVRDKQEPLADLAFAFSSELANGSRESARAAISSAKIFSERLLSPAGPSGFRIVTKLHPFWNVYYNGLSIAIAEALEPKRSERAHSYRFTAEGKSLFDRQASWRAFRMATIPGQNDDANVIVQTDISSFYEHVYHHRLENCISDLFPQDETLAPQVDRILSRVASGRSFGLPVGGQGSRILAEVLLAQVDQQLDDEGLNWHRYVDDFVLATSSHAEAYRALSILSNALADYGLTLNRTKTTVLSAKHYADYVNTQLGVNAEEAQKLLEIDLYFDPYSDDPESDLDELRTVVDSLDIAKLLNLELSKSQPDTFLVAQITRTLKLHDSEVALQLCRTLLSSGNLHAFRASWSKIMRGVAALCGDDTFEDIFAKLDDLLDQVPSHSAHLLMAEASALHFLRALRFRRTPARAEYVRKVHSGTASQTVKRACIGCWMQWRDRASFTRGRNNWNSMWPDEQRMLWLSAKEFGDEGRAFRSQVRQSLPQSWQLGIERKEEVTFASLFEDWAKK